MSETAAEQPAPAPAPPPPAPVRASAPAPVAVLRRGLAGPALTILAVLLLAGGEAFLWHLSTLQTAEDAQFTGLQDQITELQAQANRAAPAPDSLSAQADLAQKYAALAAQVNAMQSQLAADHGALTTMQASQADLTKLTARMTLISQLATARMALDAGLPLGPIANAPPALAQFAAIPPPTEAQLRETFPAAANAALAASIAGDSRISYWARVREKLASVITISDGTRVILGAPAAAVIDQAQADLTAGDLAGALAAINHLSLPTQIAMQPWLGQAQALLAARAALISMAGQR